MRRRPSCSAVRRVGAIAVCLLPVLLSATPARAQVVDLDGKYQVTEGDETAGNGSVIPGCVTPWTLEPTKSPNRDDGIVKVTTEGDTVTFSRENGKVLLVATLSPEDDSFDGMLGTAGQKGSMYVHDSSFSAARFENGGTSFEIIEPRVNYRAAGECWQVDIRGQKIEGGTSSGAATPPKARRSGNPGIAIAIGSGVVIVTVGGITVRRRRRRQAPRGVPPACQPAADELDEALNIVTALQSAQTTIDKALETGIKHHKINMIKATLVAGIKTTEIMTQAANSLRSARKALNPEGLGVQERAPAPSMLPAQVQEALTAAQEAWQAAKDKVAQLRASLQEFETAAMARMAPFVEAAEANLSLFRERVANLESRLPQANQIREALNDVEREFEAVGTGTAMGTELEEAAVTANHAREVLSGASNDLHAAGLAAEQQFGYDRARQALEASTAEVEAAQAELQTALSVDPAAPGLGSGVRGPNAAQPMMDSVRFWDQRIKSLRARVSELKDRKQQCWNAFMDAQESVDSAVAAKAREVQQWQQTLAESEATIQRIERVQDPLKKQISLLRERARAVADVTEQTVAQAKNMVADGERVLADAKQHMDPIDVRLKAEAQAKLDAAAAEAAEAELQLRRLQRDAGRGPMLPGSLSDADAGSTLRNAVGARDGATVVSRQQSEATRGAAPTGNAAQGSGALSMLGGIAKESVGVLLLGPSAEFGQSNEEIDMVLRNGQEWITVMQARARAVTREITEQQQRVEHLRHVLQICIDGKRASSGGAAAQSAGVGS